MADAPSFGEFLAGQQAPAPTTSFSDFLNEQPPKITDALPHPEEVDRTTTANARAFAEAATRPGIPKPALPPELAGDETFAFPGNPYGVSGSGPLGNFPVGQQVTVPKGGFERFLTEQVMAPALGAQDLVRGTESVAGAENARQVAGGVHEILGGGFKILTPLMGEALLTAPVKTAIALGSGIATQAGVEAGLKKLGLPEEYAAVAGDLSGLIVGATGASAVDRVRIRSALKAELAARTAAAAPDSFTKFAEEGEGHVQEQARTAAAGEAGAGREVEGERPGAAGGAERGAAARAEAGAAGAAQGRAGEHVGGQETGANLTSGQDVIRGSSNIPLSEQGRAEAAELARKTAGKFDKIYTSPLDRASETARAIAEANPQAGAPVETEKLTPWYLGQHEGQPTTAALDQVNKLVTDYPEAAPGGKGPASTKPGQSFDSFKDDFLGHVQQQIEDYKPGEKILNVTHYRDTRALEAWVAKGMPGDRSLDTGVMTSKGEVEPGDLLRLDPATRKLERAQDADAPGIYFARHGATEWNEENRGAALAEGGEDRATPAQAKLQQSAAEIAAKAKTFEPRLQATADDVAKKLGLPAPEPAQAKAADSLTRKAGRKGYDPAEAKDHVRTVQTLNSLDDVSRVLNEYRELQPGVKAEQWLETPQNRWGYRGVHLTYPMDDRINAEVQLHTPETWDAKLKAEPFYTKWRDIPEKDLTPQQRMEWEADVKKSQAVFDSAWGRLAPETISRASAAVRGFESPISPTVPSKGTQPAEGLEGSKTRAWRPEPAPVSSTTLPSSSNPKPSSFQGTAPAPGSIVKPEGAGAAENSPLVRGKAELARLEAAQEAAKREPGKDAAYRRVTIQKAILAKKVEVARLAAAEGAKRADLAAARKAAERGRALTPEDVPAAVPGGAGERQAHPPVTLGSGLGAFEPYFRESVEEMRALKAKRDEALAELERTKANPEQEKFGEGTIQYFIGERDLWAARTNQILEKARKLLPNVKDQEALSLARDFKNRPAELQQFLHGTHLALTKLNKPDYAAAMARIEKLRPAIERAQHPTPAMAAVDKVLTRIAGETLQEGQRLGFLDSRWTEEEYNPHILHPKYEGETAVPVSERVGKLLGGKIGRRFAFAERREYPTLLDAVADGVVPKTLNALDAFTIHGDKFATARASHLLVDHLRDAGLGTWGARGDPNVSAKYVEIAPHAHPFQNQVPFIDKATGQPGVATQTLFVPKYIEKALRPITDPDYMAKIPLFSGARHFQAYTKAVQLGLSFFHATTENYMALANMGPRGWLRALRADRASDSFLAAERDMIAHGGTSSIQGKSVEAYKALQPGSIPTWGEIWRRAPAIKQMDWVANKFTDFTFNNLQRRFKVTDYEMHSAAWMADHPNASQLDIRAAKHSITKEVNAVYGGLNPELLGVNRATTELARAVMLAPDWTFSNVFNVKYAAERGTPAGSLARRFWMRQLVGGVAATQAASLMFSGKPSPRLTQVYMGQDSEGKDVYQNMFFKGASGDLINTVHNIVEYGAIEGLARSMAGKAAPIVRAGMQLAANRDYLGRQIVPKGKPSSQGAWRHPLAGTVRAAWSVAKSVAPVPWAMGNVYNMLLGPDADKYGKSEVATTLFSGNPPMHVSAKEKPEREEASVWDQIWTGKVNEPQERHRSAESEENDAAESEENDE